MNRDKILILGASGFVGRHLFSRLGPTRAIATHFQQPIKHSVYFDALRMRLSEVVSVPEEISHAVILLSDKNPETCAANVKKSYAINVDSIKSIIDSLSSWDIKPIFASTEFVFDGQNGNYAETDVVNPVIVYGQQKVEVEKYLEGSCKEYVVARLAKIYGAEENDGTLFTNWLSAVKQQKDIHCAHDQIFSPMYVGDLVDALLRIIQMDVNGVFHFSNGQPASRLQFLELFLDELRKYAPVKVNTVSCSLHDFKLSEKWPLNVSLCSKKLTALTQLKMHKVEDVCKTIAQNAFVSR